MIHSPHNKSLGSEATETPTPGKSRAAIARGLVPVIWDRLFLDRALESEMLSTYSTLPQMREISYGTVRWALQLTAISQALLQKPLKKKDRDVFMLLMMGLYQLIHMQLPAHAAVNETVAACEHLNKPWAKNLINACLRQFQRQQSQIVNRLAQNAEAHYSHPAWLIQRVQRAWPQQWSDILDANNRRPTLGLRVNVNKISVSDYLQKLNNHDIDADLITGVDQGIQLHQPHGVQDLPGFQEGEVSVQNPAAQLAASWLDIKAHQRILDACAAPGGKLAHILEIKPESAQVVAVESERRRLSMIEQTLTRLALSTKVIQGDAGTPEWWDKNPFDRILLDAPCSGTGVIRRHPDIKLHRTEAQLAENVLIQSRLLEGLWPLLATGGKLLYVTCSIMPEENEDQIQAFIQKHSDAQSETLNWIHANQQIQPVRLPAGLQILPSQHEMDGFYYACIRKI